MRPAELDDSAALLSRPAMRRQILDTTARLLREHSYQSTTVRAIADRVGIKGGSLYHHFSSKDAIIVDVVNQGVAIVREAVQAAIDGLPAGVTPRGKAEAMLRAHLRSSLEHSDYVSASLRTFPHLPPPLRDAYARFDAERRAVTGGRTSEWPRRSASTTMKTFQPPV